MQRNSLNVVSSVSVKVKVQIRTQILKPFASVTFSTNQNWLHKKLIINFQWNLAVSVV